MHSHGYFVYIMMSFRGVLYVGVTGDLERRVWQHKNGSFEGFSKKYRCIYLVHFKETSDVWAALTREKEIKGWSRRKKLDLIFSSNPKLHDLSEGKTDSSLRSG